MLFSSIEFLFVFLPATVAGFALTATFISLRAGTLWLVAASLFFYGWWDVALLPLLAGSIVVNFICGRALFANRSRAVLWAGVTFDLGLLGWFKYAGFLVENLERALGTEIAELDIVLPLAISFFTFQQIAYLVDVYKGRAVEPDFLNYVMFVTFFPQLISGPIVHHAEMMPQFRDRGRRWLNRDLVVPALAFIAIGLYKKVVLADGIAPVADQVFDAANSGVPILADAWTGALAYTFQIYFDFSAYSDMAVGIALLFGIRLPLNFNSPYRATSIIDFWRRWHMTLSRFIRDYIYIPLGGNRHGRTRRCVNLMAAMLLGGLWHGAGWTFVIWGGLHGIFLIANHGLRRLMPAQTAVPPWRVWVGRVLTFIAVVVAWVFFRADDLDGAMRMLRGMVGSADGVAVLAGTRTYFFLAAMSFIVWFLPNTWQLFRDVDPVVVPHTADATETALEARLFETGYRPVLLVPLCVAILAVSLLVIIDRGGDTQRFIYMIF